MKKKIIALALCMVILSTLFSPIALAEAATAKYYRLNIFSVPGAESGTPIDFMVINEKTYIQAEQLGAYLGYEFMLSETDCTLFKTESNTAYIFDFGKRNIHAYLVDQLVEYAAPFNTIYLDGVAWLPFSYSCALLGISAHSRADGLVLLKPEVSLSETLAMLNSASGYYSFDMISEIGYADWSYAVTTVTSTIVNFLDSLLDGTFINSLGIHPTAGIYNSVDIRVIADSFVRLTNEELEAYSQLYSQEVALASDMSLLASIKEITDGAKNNSDGLSVLEKIAGEMDTPQTTALTVVVPQDLHPMVMKEATFGADYSKACKKYISLLDDNSAAAKSISTKAKDLFKSLDFSKTKDLMKEVSLVDIAAFTVNVYSYMGQMSNRDQACIDTLKKYSRASSFGLTDSLYNYASSMNTDTEWGQAIWEYIRREGGSLVLDKVAPLYNPIAIELFLYNTVKNVVPYVRGTLDSMENHELARYAEKFSDDSALVASNAFYTCFTHDTINDRYLKDLSDYMFAYLKFSMTARNFAILSVENCPSIDAAVKDKVITEMKAKNREIADYVVRLAQAAENNDNLEYGFLPSNSRIYQLTWRDDEAQMCQFVETVGAFIEKSEQITLPDETIDLRNSISEERAIELVKRAMSGGLMDILDQMMDGLISETLSFSVIGTYRVHKEDSTYSDCYMVALSEGNVTEENLFFVTLDGKYVWLGAPYNGGYYVLYQMNLLRFNPIEFLELLRKMERELIKETMK